MTISPQDFRDALRCFAAGVTLVTARDGPLVYWNRGYRRLRSGDGS